METTFKMLEFLAAHGNLELKDIPPKYRTYYKGEELKSIPVIAYFQTRFRAFVRELYFSKKDGNLTLYIRLPELYPEKPNNWEKLIIELSLETLPKLCHDYNVSWEHRDEFINQLLGSLQNNYLIDKCNYPISELGDFFMPTYYNECPLNLRVTLDNRWEASYLTFDPKQPKFKKIADTLENALLGLQTKIIINDFSESHPQAIEQLQTLLEENNP
jgi:hypothetical protein